MALDLRMRLVAYTEPSLLILIGIYGHLLAIIDILFFQWRPQDLFSWSVVQRQAFSKFWLRLDSLFFTYELESPVPSLVSSCSGTILELGPGSGSQVLRYDPAKVTKIYGVEPNQGLHARLRENVKKAGLDDVYTIVPCGVEDTEGLRKHGIEGEMFDTVLSVQVLCGVPKPEEAVKSCFGLLKKGGEMVVYEHVENEVDRLTWAVQNLYNIIWPHVLCGCYLNRRTGRTLVEAGPWSKVELEFPTKEDAWSTLPRVSGKLIK